MSGPEGDQLQRDGADDRAGPCAELGPVWVQRDRGAGGQSDEESGEVTWFLEQA